MSRRSRRSFLSVLTYPLAATVVPVKLQRAIISCLGPGFGARLVGSALLRSRSAREIGRQCLREGITGSDGLALEHLVRIRSDDIDRKLWADLKAQMEADFARGDTVRVSGWVLSRTEARLYLLAAKLELEDLG